MLNDSRSTSKRKFDFFIAALIIISTAILFVGGFDAEESYQLPAWLHVIDNLILVVFLFEYLARVAYTKPDLPDVVRLSKMEVFKYHIKARILWMLTPMAIIDLLAILPLFAMNRAYANFKLFRVLRILRLMRLYRLAIFYNPLEKLGALFEQTRCSTSSLSHWWRSPSPWDRSPFTWWRARTTRM